jgi:hypothetical protein
MKTPITPLRLERDVREALERLADAHSISMAEVVSWLILRADKYPDPTMPRGRRCYTNRGQRWQRDAQRAELRRITAGDQVEDDGQES